MTCTTASGLLPAGIAVYVQRGPNGVRLETGYSLGLEGFTSQSDRGRSSSLLPAWEAGSSEGLPCGLSIRTATGQCGLQHLHRVLPFVEGGDGVDLQIHACVWGDRNGNLVLSCRSAVDAASGPAYRGGGPGGGQAGGPAAF